MVVRNRRRRMVAVNDRGHIIGEDHPMARLSDEDVALMRALHDEGLSSAMIARKFEVDRRTAHSIITYRRRAETAFGYVVPKRLRRRPRG